jgi:hypothetical protein
MRLAVAVRRRRARPRTARWRCAGSSCRSILACSEMDAFWLARPEKTLEFSGLAAAIGEADRRGSAEVHAKAEGQRTRKRINRVRARALGSEPRPVIAGRAASPHDLQPDALAAGVGQLVAALEIPAYPHVAKGVLAHSVERVDHEADGVVGRLVSLRPRFHTRRGRESRPLKAAGTSRCSSLEATRLRLRTASHFVPVVTTALTLITCRRQQPCLASLVSVCLLGLAVLRAAAYVARHDVKAPKLVLEGWGDTFGWDSHFRGRIRLLQLRLARTTR